MLLVLDLGNTNLTAGVFRGKELVCDFRMATDRARTGDQYAADLTAMMALKGIAPTDVHGAILGSVVPGLDAAFCRAVKQVIGKDPLMVGPGIKSGMNIRIDNPAQLGADLLVGAVAAYETYGAPCIVWDMGTATTVSVIDEKGAFCGGAIMAGVGTALDSLVSRASLLPNIRVEAPKKVIGTNTTDCMRSGAVFGAVAMLEGMCDRIEAELCCPATVVVTGGLGAEIAACSRRRVNYDGNLLLNGLRILYERNT